MTKAPFRRSASVGQVISRSMVPFAMISLVSSPRQTVGTSVYALPALAAREDDIALFGDIYLSHLSTQKSGFEAHLTPNARAFIRAQSWPGNLSELRSTMLRAALQSATPTAITAEDIARSLAVDPSPLAKTGAGRLPTEDEIEAVWTSLKALLDQGMSIDGVVAQFEQLALQEAGGNVSAAARRLGLTRAKLDYRLTAQGARTSRQR